MDLKSSTIDARTLITKYNTISDININSILETRLHNQEFLEISRNERTIEGNVDKNTGKARVQTAINIVKLFVELLLQENYTQRISKENFDQCYCALVPACLRFKTKSYKMLYASVKTALPNAEVTETLIGRVGFKEFSMDNLRDFIESIKSLREASPTSVSEVDLEAGKLQENGLNEKSRHVGSILFSPLVSTDMHVSSLVTPTSTSSVSERSFNVQKSQIGSTSSFSERSTIPSSWPAAKKTSGAYNEAVIIDPPAVILDEEDFFVHFGLPVLMTEIQLLTVKSCSRIPPVCRKSSRNV